MKWWIDTRIKGKPESVADAYLKMFGYSGQQAEITDERSIISGSPGITGRRSILAALSPITKKFRHLRKVYIV